MVIQDVSTGALCLSYTLFFRYNQIVYKTWYSFFPTNYRHMPLKTLIEHIRPVRAYLTTLRSIAHKISSHREIVSTHDCIETHTIQSPNCNQQKNVFDVNQYSAISSLLTKLIVLHVFTQAHTHTRTHLHICVLCDPGRFHLSCWRFPSCCSYPQRKTPITHFSLQPKLWAKPWQDNLHNYVCVWKLVCGYKLDVRFHVVQVCTDVAMAVSQLCDVMRKAPTPPLER